MSTRIGMLESSYMIVEKGPSTCEREKIKLHIFEEELKDKLKIS